MTKKSEEYKKTKMSASLKRIPFRLCTVFKGNQALFVTTNTIFFLYHCDPLLNTSATDLDKDYEHGIFSFVLS